MTLLDVVSLTAKTQLQLLSRSGSIKHKGARLEVYDMAGSIQLT